MVTYFAEMTLFDPDTGVTTEKGQEVETAHWSPDRLRLNLEFGHVVAVTVDEEEE